jgi:hypothetical protein
MADPSIKILIEAVNSAQGTINEVKTQIKSLKSTADEVKQGTSGIFDGFKKGLGEAQGLIGGLTPQLGGLVGNIAMLGGAVGTAAGAFKLLGDSLRTTQEHAKAIGDLARVTGMTTEETSRFATVANIMGVSTETMSSAMTMLSRRMMGLKDAEMQVVDESGKSVDVFDKFKISVTNLDGSIRPLPQIWEQISARVREGSGTMAAAGIAAQFFRGNMARELLPMLLLGKEKFEELSKVADKFGLVLTGENIDNVRQYGRQMRILNEAFTGLKLAIGEAAIPPLIELLTWLNKVAGAIADVVRQIAALKTQGVDITGGKGDVGTKEKVGSWIEKFGKASQYVPVPGMGLFGKGVEMVGKGMRPGSNYEGQFDIFEASSVATEKTYIPPKGAGDKAGKDKTESIALMNYHTAIEALNKYVRERYITIESGAKKEEALLELSRTKGLVSETDYEDQKVAIISKKMDEENIAISASIEKQKAAFDKLASSGIDADKLRSEKEKLQASLDQQEAVLQRNAGQKEIIQIQTATAHEKYLDKMAERDDKYAGETEKFTNRVAKNIDDMHVKFLEMKPGDALVADYDRELTAMANATKRAYDMMMQVEDLNSELGQKRFEEWSKRTREQTEMASKKPEVTREAGYKNREDDAARLRNINDQRLAYSLLTGQMEAYTRIQMEISIEELKAKQIRMESQPEIVEGLQRQIDYMQQVLDMYDNFGPAFTGFVEGLKDIERESKDTFNKAKGYTKQFVEAFSTSLGDMLGDFLKFDGNFMKDMDALKDYWKDFWGKMVKIFQEIFMDEMKLLITGFLKGLMGGSGSGAGLGGGIIASLFGGGGEKGEGSGTGTGSATGILGLGVKGYSWYNKITKLWNWATGGGDNLSAAIGANPELGGDVSGLGGFDASSLGGVDFASYGMEGAGSEAGASFGSEAGIAMSEEMAPALESGMGAMMDGVGEGMAVGAAEAGTEMGTMAVAEMVPIAGTVVAAAMTMYMAYQSMNRDMKQVGLANIGANVAGLQGQFGGQADKAGGLSQYYNYDKSKGEWGKMVNGKWVSAGTGENVYYKDANAMGEGQSKEFEMGGTAKGKVLSLTKTLAEIERWREDAKLTEEQVKQLTEQAVGPMNQEVLKAAQAFQKLNDVSRFTEAGLKLDVKTVGELKTQFAGMDQKTIESIPNLQSYGQILEQMGINFGTFNSETINAAIVTGQLKDAFQEMATGMDKADPGAFSGLLAKMKSELSGTGASLLGMIPDLGQFWSILQQIGITIDQIPSEKNINFNYNLPETVPVPQTTMHKGGFIRYHPFGGRLASDEVPFIGQKGEYVLSQKDVEFVNKVKGTGGGYAEVVNIPPILPKVNVIVNNQSGAGVVSAGAVRVSDSEYIIDVLLKDLHSGSGRFRQALSFI